ncbi:unnamed protein product [Heligmosomoides polygyrus]|uniref:Endo/exonuclease/phosphatase domain-containing protein n=1 Tax=Heligmosomoides polygyrus TaxID=6339 RepID=A0A183FEN8_HELPZ|nr:unnamed protein product [Heligmosomoides polygyrus]
MTICTYIARTLAWKASVEDLMTQVREIKHDVIGLIETRRQDPLHVAYDLGEELFLETYDTGGEDYIGVLLNMHFAIDSYKSLISRTGTKRIGSVPVLTVFVAYAPTSDYDEEVETFYVELDKFYEEDLSYKVIFGDPNARIGPRRSPEELHLKTYGLKWNEQGRNCLSSSCRPRTFLKHEFPDASCALRWTWKSPVNQL